MALTVAEIATLIESHDYASLEDMNADKRTRLPIPLKELEVLANRSGMVAVLQQKLQDEAVDTDDKVKITSYLAHVQSHRQTHLPTNETDVAEQADAVLRVLSAPSELVAAFYALGGGLVVPEEVPQGDWDAALAYNVRRADANATITAAYTYAESVARVAQGHVDDPGIALPVVPAPIDE